MIQDKYKSTHTAVSISALASMEAMVKQLQEERDDCLEALKVVVDAVDCCSGDGIGTWADCFDTARAAIARCTDSAEVME